MIDSDEDGVADEQDSCEGHDDQTDVDQDGTPDGCDSLLDNDGDGVANAVDQCAGYDDAVDLDEDGTPDGCDDQVDVGGPQVESTENNTTLNQTTNQSDDGGINPSSGQADSDASKGDFPVAVSLVSLGAFLSVFFALLRKNRPDDQIGLNGSPSDGELDLVGPEPEKQTLAQDASNPMMALGPTGPQPLPLPTAGLPDGWTMEQWAHYGHQWQEEDQ